VTSVSARTSLTIAIAHEWLASYAGSERVVEQMLAIYPEADLFSLVDFLTADQRDFIQEKSVETSFIQKLPFARKAFRQYLPLMPFAVEQFDLSKYDIILSSHHAVAKGVLTRADQLHISYVHSPLRYGWDLQWQYLEQANLQRGLKSWFVRWVLHYLRLWDVVAANRVDCFVANSRFIARRIWKTYCRRARVIYPPVAVEQFRADRPREDFYLTVSRFVPYKRVDVTIAAFNQLGLSLVVIGDGPDEQRLRQLAGPNIQMLGFQPDAVVADYLERCRGFIFSAEEDFGITVVEAQAAGAPVIAYGRGGSVETVVPDETGLLFYPQTASALASAVTQFEQQRSQFDPWVIRANAERFGIERFRQEFRDFVEDAWVRFQRGDALE
jgi:glycosyltransferase involved in cell wall biosynthesis